jgi:hypothetical protein
MYLSDLCNLWYLNMNIFFEFFVSSQIFSFLSTLKFLSIFLFLTKLFRLQTFLLFFFPLLQSDDKLEYVHILEFFTYNGFSIVIALYFGTSTLTGTGKGTRTP